MNARRCGGSRHVKSTASPFLRFSASSWGISGRWRPAVPIASENPPSMNSSAKVARAVAVSSA
eukprot:7334814-Pyramimonas_sp.AAC.1